MILGLLYNQGNVTGGELYDLGVYEFLKENYDCVFPDQIRRLEGELGNPIKHALNSLNSVKEKNPRVAVVELYSGCRNVLAIRWMKRRGKKLITIVSGLREKYRFGSKLSKRVARRCERYVIEESDIIVAISEWLGEYVKVYARESAKIIVAKPGIKVSAGAAQRKTVLGENEDSPVKLLAVGACNKVKGTKYLVEALKYLKGYNIMLNVVGPYTKSDPYFKEVRKIISENGLGELATFHGFVDGEQLTKLFEESSIFVAPSLFEGYGIALAEALSFGLPVVATNVGAIPELIEDNVNGLLVEPANGKSIAMAIRALIGDVKVRERMRLNNLAKASSLPTWKDFRRVLAEELIPAIEMTTGIKAVVGR